MVLIVLLGVFAGGEWVTTRAKVPKLVATPPESEVGSEEGGSESGSPVPDGRRTRGRGQRKTNNSDVQQ